MKRKISRHRYETNNLIGCCGQLLPMVENRDFPNFIGRHCSKSGFLSILETRYRVSGFHKIKTRKSGKPAKIGKVDRPGH